MISILGGIYGPGVFRIARVGRQPQFLTDLLRQGNLFNEQVEPVHLEPSGVGRFLRDRASFVLKSSKAISRDKGSVIRFDFCLQDHKRKIGHKTHKTHKILKA
jgi:hypothetical protein